MQKRRPPPKAIIKALEARYGRYSDSLLDQLHKIAFGKKIEVATDIPNVVRVMCPTVGEMHAAVALLLAYQHGKPTQSIDMAVYEERPRLDVDRLTLEELHTMDRLAKKGTVIDGELMQLEPGKEKP